MKYRWSMVLVLGSLMLFPLSIVRADEGRQDGWHKSKDFGLTDDQKTKLKPIREAQEKALKPMWRKQRDLTLKLSDQLQDKASDSDITRTLAELKANREAMQTESKRFKSEREAILTPTQRARMMLARDFHGKHRGHDGEGWHHHEGDHDGHDGHDGHDDHETDSKTM